RVSQQMLSYGGTSRLSIVDGLPVGARSYGRRAGPPLSGFCVSVGHNSFSLSNVPMDIVGGGNRVILVGTISKDGVTVKYAPSGTPCANFALMLSEQGQDGKVHTIF